MYVMFKIFLKKSVLIFYIDYDNLFVEVKFFVVICIIDIIILVEVLYFDELVIFFVNFYRVFGLVFKEILI